MRISFLLYPREYMAMIGPHMIHSTNGSCCLSRDEPVLVQGAGDVG